MPVQKSIYERYVSGDVVDASSLEFAHKPSSVSNDRFAETHGFVVKSQHKQKSKYDTLSPETVALRKSYIQKKFDSDEWKNSKMRDRMYRLRMYTSKQHPYINRDGEESMHTYFPAFNSYEIEECLNRKHKQFEETGDPAYLHDWSCSVRNGCSEEELRDTILDLRAAEQNYPEQKKRRVKWYYTAPDDDGFIKKVILQRNNNNKRAGKSRGGRARGKKHSERMAINLSNFATSNIVDLDKDLEDEEEKK